MYFVYIIYSEGLNGYYVGRTIDLEKRINEHNTGFYKKSFTAKANDWSLFFSMVCRDKSQALNIENHIKKMKSKIYIENLKLYPEIAKKLKEKYT